MLPTKHRKTRTEKDAQKMYLQLAAERKNTQAKKPLEQKFTEADRLFQLAGKQIERIRKETEQAEQTLAIAQQAY